MADQKLQPPKIQELSKKFPGSGRPVGIAIVAKPLHHFRREFALLHASNLHCSDRLRLVELPEAQPANQIEKKEMSKINVLPYQGKRENAYGKSVLPAAEQQLVVERQLVAERQLFVER